MRRVLEHDLQQLITEGQNDGELLTFFRTRVKVGYISIEDQMLYAEDDYRPYVLGQRDNTLSHVLVLPTTFAERRFIHEYDRINFQYSHGRIVVPPLDTFTSIWMGIRLAHELKHARDEFYGIEEYDDGGNVSIREYGLGELRANNLEMRLIDRATNGRFAQELQRLDIQLPSPDSGFPDRTCFIGTIELFSPLDSLFPPALSQAESRARGGAYTLAVNFLIVERLGLGLEGRLAVHRSVFESSQ